MTEDLRERILGRGKVGPNSVRQGIKPELDALVAKARSLLSSEAMDFYRIYRLVEQDRNAGKP